MDTRRGLTSKVSNRLALTSAAFQDHITRKLLLPSLSLSDPLLKNTRKMPTKRGNSQRVINKDLERFGGHEEKEYVLTDGPPTPLTLAEKMGLVAAGPFQRLKEEQWTNVKARSVEQGESARPCVICKEEFHLKPQVLLSCSHVFHRVCVQAFERFSGKKRCPVCRREPYETRVIHDAAHLYRHHCAARIQACWRGYAVRKWYRRMKKTRCPKDKLLRQRFFEERMGLSVNGVDFTLTLRKREHCPLVNQYQLRVWLQELNDSFVRYCHTDTEAFLSDIDHSLSSSRQVFEELLRKHMCEPQEDDWDTIQRQVMERGAWDCPICLTQLHQPIPTQTETCRYHPPPPHRHTVLLSCSHVFHQICLESFETFSADTRLSCPLCRSVYHKKLL